ncbi:MAG TPA: ABC transporter permease [Solirubrobacteraceae bacterium]|jgi:ABC-2 type transport system permease protein|nr:ABC transporter permease [Solirubrobacteraceae bacterium]
MSATALPSPTSDEVLGEPIQGPRALTGDWRRFWHLSFNIAKTDWKLRFYGSALGVVWQLVRPLMLFGVLYVFFTKIGHVNSTTGVGSQYYGAQLLGSIVLFTFWAESTAGSVRCVVDHEALVRKIQFPRLVIPMSVVMFTMFNLALNLIVVLIFTLASGVRPMASWVELPLILLMLGVFAAGTSMLLSAAFIYFRDIQPIWDVVNQIVFYASPVMISYATVQLHLSRTLLHIYEMSPLAVVMQQFRHAMITHGTPSAPNAMGGWSHMVIPVGIVIITFVAGFYVFNRVAPKVAEIL